MRVGREDTNEEKGEKDRMERPEKKRGENNRMERGEKDLRVERNTNKEKNCMIKYAY